jgi:uncharacterized membrane protein
MCLFIPDKSIKADMLYFQSAIAFSAIISMVVYINCNIRNIIALSYYIFIDLSINNSSVTISHHL